MVRTMAVEAAKRQIGIRPRARILLDRLREFEDLSVADAAGSAIREACERRGIDTSVMQQGGRVDSDGNGSSPR